MLNINESNVYEVYKNRLFDLSGNNRCLSFKLNKKSFDMYSLGEFNVNSFLNNVTYKVTMKEYVSSRVDKEKIPFEKEYKGYLKRKQEYEKVKEDFKKKESAYLERKVQYDIRKTRYEEQKREYENRKLEYEIRMKEFEDKKARFEKRRAEYEKRKEQYEFKLNEYTNKKYKSIELGLTFTDEFKEVFLEKFTESFDGVIEPFIEVFEEMVDVWVEEPPIFTLELEEEPCFDEALYTRKYTDEFVSILRDLSKINSEAQNYNKETGNKSLYLCYYFISGRLKGDNTIKMYAPLFLIPITLNVGNTHFSCSFSNEEILINRTMLIAIMTIYGKTINLNSFELDELTDDFIDDIISKLEEIDIEIKKVKEPTKIPSNTIASVTDDLILHNHLVLSNLTVSNSIYDDYIKLENDMNDSVKNLISNEYVKDVDIEKVKSDYNNLDLVSKEISLITKLDTSQELAVYMANKSNNLVIYGPPGTGKSETILNIISDSLAQNKKILVVSEKKSAINVLYNRLGLLQKLSLIFDTSSLRLSDLKVQINNNLNNSIQLKNLKPVDFILKEMEDCHIYFNNIYSMLNKDFNGRKISDWYSEKKPEIRLSELEIEKLRYKIHKESILKDMLSLDYAAFYSVLSLVGDVEKVTLYRKLNLTEKRFNTFQFLLKNNIDVQSLIYELLSIQEKSKLFDMYMTQFLNAKVTLLEKNNEIKKFESINEIKYEKQISELEEELNIINEKHNNLKKREEVMLGIINQLNYVTPKVYKNNLQQYLLSVKDSLNVDISFLVSSYLQSYDEYITYKSKLFRSSSKLCTKEENSNHIKNELIQSIKSLVMENEKIMSKLWIKISGLITEKQKIEEQYNLMIVERTNLFQDIERLKENMLDSERCLISEIGQLPIFWGLYKKDILLQTSSEVEDFLTLIMDYRVNKESLLDLIEDNASIIFLYRFLEANNLLGLEDSVQLLKHFYIENQIAVIEKDNDTALREIKRYEGYQDSFAAHEKDYLSSTVENLYKKWVTQRSSNYSLPIDYLNTERKFLSEKDSKSRKFKLRQFVNAFFEVIINYFPIILATPEAVSKFLPLIKDSFDVIVFDEASQLLIENAIPSIYRSKKVIVVGDDKQLKPSKFFKTSMNTEEELGLICDEDLTDEELLFIPDSISQLSLLDNAKNKYNSISLLYHYRSMYSELIDFSNAVFYKGQLKLAPNVLTNTDNSVIQRIKVEGTWIHNQNIVEAKRVVELIKEIFASRKNNETIGIITFNKKQQECIENHILDECLKNADFNAKYRREQNRIEKYEDKSIFIKNIENVQGDERDIIIFSVGYALNSNGKLLSQFGPLSQDGGENRLNVAISRAKQQIYVITSFEPEELQVSETKNIGPKLFKEYLEYVKYVSDNDTKMVKALLRTYNAHNNIIEEKSFNSPFEEQVYKALVARGYRVDTQIGNFGFKVDMGIYDEETGRYLIGIECDGLTYHSSERAKDRDIARQAFLESRGWKIFRIWSSVWWKDNTSVLDRLDLVVEKQKEYLSSLESLKAIVTLRDWEDNNNTVDVYRYIIEKDGEKNKFNTTEFFDTYTFNKRFEKDRVLLGVRDNLKDYHKVEEIPIYFESEDNDLSIKDAWGYATYNILEGTYVVLNLDDLSLMNKIYIISVILHEYFHTVSTVNCYDYFYLYKPEYEDKTLNKLILEIEGLNNEKAIKSLSNKLSGLTGDKYIYWLKYVSCYLHPFYSSVYEGITELLAKFYTINLYVDNKEKENNFMLVNDNFELIEGWSTLLSKYKNGESNYPWDNYFNPSYPYNVALILTFSLFGDLKKMIKYYLESDLLSLHIHLSECIPNYNIVFEYLKSCSVNLRKTDFDAILTIIMEKG